MATSPETACPQATCLVNAGLHLEILLPTDPDYDAREASYFSNGNKLSPGCIVCPRSSEQVSRALCALVKAEQKFAIRSGGHMVHTGSNNIQDGVTVDLGSLSTVVFDEESQTVSIGPGARWKQVYEVLHRYGRIVAGGREGNVGAGGFLLGGGYTWVTARKGWACDNVLSYEVVLADGSIVIADEDTHTDLFRALKGGSNNFGIVTNFTMSTVPCRSIWGGIGVTSKDFTSEALDLMSSFTDHVPRYPDSNLIVVLGYVPDMKDNVVSTAVVDTEAVALADNPAFKGWSKLPKMMDTTKITSLFEIGSEISVPSDYYNIWFTLCFKNDKVIMAKASEIHSGLVDDLRGYISDGDFMTQCTLQPLPTIFGERSVAAGGNVMGIERNTCNGILFQIAAMVRTADQQAFAYPRVKASVELLRGFAAAQGGTIDWLYMNYADGSQDVLGSYGAENVQRMKEAALKYDPQQVFQKLCPGGWKISDVES